MQNNPFSNIKPITINIDEFDKIFKEDTSEKKEYGLFEVPLLFIYKNETTNTFIEFELENMNSDITASEAIEIFMQRVLEFGKPRTMPLPQELLSALSDVELNLFMLAHIEKYYYQRIKEMIYIQKKDHYYKDKYGFTYIVASIGIKDVVLLYEQKEKLLTLHTTPQQIQQQGDKLYVTRIDSI